VGVILEGQLRKRRSLDVQDADGVERDVDAARFGGHRIRMRVDGLLVEGVHLSRFRLAARGGDLPRHLVELVEGAPGEEDGRSLAREGAGYRAADRATHPLHRSLRSCPEAAFQSPLRS
jgi:hypothetical protein